MKKAVSRLCRAGVAFSVVVAWVVGVGLTGPATVAAGTATPAYNGILHVVRIGNDGTFDRVVFEFYGVTVPPATLNGPRANSGTVPMDPSDEPVAIAGAQVVTVRMEAIATYAASNPPQVYTGPSTFSPTATTNVVQVTKTGDFEGVLNWTIGLRAGTAVTLKFLTNPPRVVVDVPHAAAPPAQPAPQTPSLTG